MNCKATGGLIRYLTRVIPDGLLLSIAHVRFTWFNKCKRFAGLNFKCKLEVGLIIKNCQLFSGRGKAPLQKHKRYAQAQDTSDRASIIQVCFHAR